MMFSMLIFAACKCRVHLTKIVCILRRGHSKLLMESLFVKLCPYVFLTDSSMTCVRDILVGFSASIALTHFLFFLNRFWNR